MNPNAAVVSKLSLRVEHVEGFEFRVKFDKPQFAPLLVDTPPPLGHDKGPDAEHVLAAAIGNCLSASLLFCLVRAKVPSPAVSAEVELQIVRNEARRLRIGKINVMLHTNLAPDDPALARCISTFEEFCTVTQSVRQGIEVDVQVARGP